jgi:hypothetical protein
MCSQSALWICCADIPATHDSQSLDEVSIFGFKSILVRQPDFHRGILSFFAATHAENPKIFGVRRPRPRTSGAEDSAGEHSRSPPSEGVPQSPASGGSAAQSHQVAGAAPVGSLLQAAFPAQGGGYGGIQVERLPGGALSQAEPLFAGDLSQAEQSFADRDIRDDLEEDFLMIEEEEAAQHSPYNPPPPPRG